MSRPKHYTPALNRFVVSALYHEAKLRGQPMTTVANRIMESALVNSEGWKRAEQSLQESPTPYRLK